MPGLFLFIFVFSMVQSTINVQYKFRRWRDLNCGPLVSEATALPTEPQPLPYAHSLSRFDCFDSNTFRWGKSRQISFLTSLFKVKRWITLNEPWVTSVQGHGWGDHAPGIKAPGVLDYVAAHNQIRAHAKAYRLYHAEFAESQKGKVWSSKSRHLWWKITLQDQVAHPFL